MNFFKNKNNIIISNPLFKHSHFYIIIDLFIYYNKENDLTNMLLRRSLYKYMYSMYINSLEKMKETLNRPRFFYINIIEPKIVQFYTKIVEIYGKLLIRKHKAFFIYLILYIINSYKKKNIYKKDFDKKLIGLNRNKKIKKDTYIEDIERKSNEPIDETKLTL